MRSRKKLHREHRLTEVAKGNLQLKEASICTGIGVSTFAIHETLQKAGIQTSVEWVVEKDGRYLQVADDNNPAITPEVTVFEGTIEEVEASLLPATDLLSFSLACDVHSPAGKSKHKINAPEDIDKGATDASALIKIVQASNPGGDAFRKCGRGPE